MEQKILFSLESILDLNPLQNYQLLFENLSKIKLTQPKSTGRKPVLKEALLNALILKNLKSIPTLTELCQELHDNPSAALRCSFDIRKPVPSVERFSSFLRDMPHQYFVNIRNHLVLQLIELDIISGEYISIDSCPIPVNVKENNLKTNITLRYDKQRIPKGDPDARLGVYVTFPSNNNKTIQYFWGYRNHTTIDATVELPIWEITKPANVHDSTMFIPIFKELQNNFNIDIKAVLADGIYDCAYILRFILNELKAKPRIAQNSRNTSENKPHISKTGNRICEAKLEMLNRGTFYDKVQDRWRKKWVCPLHHSNRYRYQFIVCPIYHPKFFEQKGCYAYDRIDEDVRSRIDYGSPSFKKDTNLRSGSERVFSRLLDICMQNPTVRGLKAVANNATIAHITVLLVALTAAKNNVKDQVRFIKSFIPNFKT